MSVDLSQHQTEIQRNLRSWERKPLLQEVYAGFYRRIVALVKPEVPGVVVEIGSGIGNLKAHLPGAVTTDLFPNPWLDVVCDGYELPFACGSVSHLVLFDVFHHLEAPNVFLQEARRVLGPRGRLILFEPYISMASAPVYGLLHHEPVGMGRAISQARELARPRGYYAAQGNATRLFFRQEVPGWPPGWEVVHREAFSAFQYLLSGGYSKPAFYPAGCLRMVQRVDGWLSRWPRVFGGRCLVAMEKKGD